MLAEQTSANKGLHVLQLTWCTDDDLGEVVMEYVGPEGTVPEGYMGMQTWGVNWKLADVGLASTEHIGDNNLYCGVRYGVTREGAHRFPVELTLPSKGLITGPNGLLEDHGFRLSDILPPMLFERLYGDLPIQLGAMDPLLAEVELELSDVGKAFVTGMPPDQWSRAVRAA